jgi:chorismate mutase
MDTAIDLSDASKALDLSNIRFQLMSAPYPHPLAPTTNPLSRLEDTITFHLIERVQFPLNPTIYNATTLPIPSPNPLLPATLSLADFLHSETERLHSLVRRFDAPDEHPFFPGALQRPMLQPLSYPQILHPNTVNVNPDILRSYREQVLPQACAPKPGGDKGETKENYGSAATCDVQCLQALSRRIHFGKFVAESKFQKETARFVDLIKKEDRQGLDAAITDKKVETMVLERLRLKAKTYGTDPSTSTAEGEVKIDVEAVVEMYKSVVIPLTKIVEVEYLMQRLVGTEWE